MSVYFIFFEHQHVRMGTNPLSESNNLNAQEKTCMYANMLTLVNALDLRWEIVTNDTIQF